MTPDNVQGRQRKDYEPPSVARVIVDPVKEMLTVCETDPGKVPGTCNDVGS